MRRAPQLDFARPAREPDILIEPGAARNRRPLDTAGRFRSGGRRGGRKTAQASFIAAAHIASPRRLRPPAPKARKQSTGVRSRRRRRVVARARGVLERRRKPICCLAALVGLLGALQIASVYLESRQAPPPAVVRPAGPAKSDEVKPQSMARTPGRRRSPTMPRRTRARPFDERRRAARHAEGAGSPVERPVAAEISLRLARPAVGVDDRRRAPDAADEEGRPRAGGKHREESGRFAGRDGGDRGCRAAATPPPSTNSARAAPIEIQIARDLKGAAEMFERSATRVYAAGNTGSASCTSAASASRAILRSPSSGISAGRRSRQRARHAQHRGHSRGTATASRTIRRLKWFRRAAEHGVRDSQYNLAILMRAAWAAWQDLVQSYAWFAAAASQGDEDAAKSATRSARSSTQSLWRAQRAWRGLPSAQRRSGGQRGHAAARRLAGAAAAAEERGQGRADRQAEGLTPLIWRLNRRPLWVEMS